jgi:hypothetical protein
VTVVSLPESVLSVTEFPFMAVTVPMARLVGAVVAGPSCAIAGMKAHTLQANRRIVSRIEFINVLEIFTFVERGNEESAASYFP